MKTSACAIATSYARTVAASAKSALETSYSGAVVETSAYAIATNYACAVAASAKCNVEASCSDAVVKTYAWCHCDKLCMCCCGIREMRR